MVQAAELDMASLVTFSLTNMSLSSLLIAHGQLD